MTATYPSDIASLTNPNASEGLNQPSTGVPHSVIETRQNEEIVAIETELGTGLKGTLVSLAARLNIVLNADGTLKSEAVPAPDLSAYSTTAQADLLYKPIGYAPDLSAYLTSATAALTYQPLMGADDNYVTDAEKTVIGNTSGTNTGDQTLGSLGAQAQLNGTGFVKATGTTISYDNSTYYKSGDSPTFANIDLSDSGFISLDTAPASDHNATGTKVVATAGEALVFGDMCYLKSDGKYWKADADAIATMPVMVMSLATISANATGNFLHQGYVRDDTYNWTIGGLVYASVTAGAIAQTIPTGADDVVQIVGYAVTADIIYFNPQYNFVVDIS